jgi:hypothetical protein
MITDVITNPVAKAAIDALQKGDKHAWQALFAEEAELFDDGHPRSLDEFSGHALGHERFQSIDEVKDGGLSIEGQFHSDTWGEFQTYFRFTLDRSKKISRLDIGQAD